MIRQAAGARAGVTTGPSRWTSKKDCDEPFSLTLSRKLMTLWKSIDDFQKALEAVPTAERSGPEWDRDGVLSKRFIELIKRLGDLGHQLRLGLAARDEFRASTKH
jgi:hypothetical protein